MAETKRQIHDAATLNTSLLTSLRETDYALGALKEQTQHVDELRAQLGHTTAKLKAVSNRTMMKEWQSNDLKKSHMKRFAYTATGKKDKFNAMASEKDMEYQQVHQEQQEVAAAKQAIEGLLKDGEDVKAQLTLVVEKHDDAQSQLDALYDRIFGNASPRFPEEVEKDEIVKRALYFRDDIKRRQGLEEKVAELLEQVAACGLEASRLADAARSHAGGRGLISLMMRDDKLEYTKVQVSKMLSLYQQAEQTSPFVKPLEQFKTKNSFGANAIFGSLGHFGVRDDIKDSEEAIRRARVQIKEQAQLTKRRISDLQKEAEGANEEVREAEDAHRKVRSGIFERLRRES